MSDVRQRAGRPDRAGRSAFDLLASKIHRPPLDRRKEWYHYHHLFRDMLQGELRRREPGLIPVLLRRAAGWCLRNPMPEEALEYSIAAGDVNVVARLEGKLGVRTYQRGASTTVQRWLGWLEDRGGIEERPMVAVLASIICALTARAAAAGRWADAVDRWQYGDATWPGHPDRRGRGAAHPAGQGTQFEHPRGLGADRR